MIKFYDTWWQEGSKGDQDMEDSHQTGWQNVIGLIDRDDVLDRDILDFGCNQGGFLRKLYDEIPFHSAYGIDLAKQAIKTANQRAGTYPICYVQTGEARALKQKFHTIISTSVLYLIKDLDNHFSMMSDVLNEQGVYYALFTDQSKNPSFEYMRAKIDRFGATKMQNKTLTEVVDSLVKNGFSVELRKEYTSTIYDVTNYHDFYLTVDDYILSCESSYLIKATKKGVQL
ncbi:methyltransferase domain-containing protein [Enterococcus sp. BWB1-3]|uniref:class I SAM-dependent methyltransferase n=1 Tax=unclassified Enterococcus TaxID=2608891 RepID=UPI001924A088|nr:MULTISPECIES: class I SAM-dependent methyltransferase [unclassified Enterococcus]MBL1230611.1 methyltransferase domain-containing protein [Enterococcus sp. BWB1-3]MCB5950919.1 class I SAM-dependent methyltransferase [Enterococcus sp. BWT-B8]